MTILLEVGVRDILTTKNIRVFLIYIILQYVYLSPNSTLDRFGLNYVCIFQWVPGWFEKGNFN